MTPQQRLTHRKLMNTLKVRDHFMAKGSDDKEWSMDMFVEMGGETKSIAAWARQYRMDGRRILWRLENGWPVKEAITQPVTKTLPRRSRR